MLATTILLLVTAASPATSEISADVRDTFSLDRFYTKCAVIHGMPVIGSDKVADEAIAEAAFVIGEMLRDRPQVIEAVAKNRGRVCVMAAKEMSSELPEFAPVQRPARVYYDRRGRGYGNHIACSVGEENLLHFPGDPYPTESILVHEFAHLLEKLGLPDTVDQFDAKLTAAYESAMADGLWANTYAATNKAEYWAELTQSWFDTNRADDKLHNHVDTRDEVKEYDPRGAALLVEAYGDGDWRYSRADTRWTLKHLATWKPETSPKFEWPAEVVARYEALKKEDAESVATLLKAGVETLLVTANDTLTSAVKRGPKTSVMIVNNRPKPIALHWIKPDGTTKSYGDVDPGRVVSRSTFAGHAWEVRSEADEPLGRFVASESIGRVLVNTPPVAAN